MDTTTRRNQILDIITQTDTPTTAKALSDKLGVSRQVIVGDVALLRAEGHEITATSRGYTIAPKSNAGGENQYLGTIVSRHAAEDTKAELYEIVNMGGTIVNVIVEHDLYGNITGSLNLKTREDVDSFLERMESSQDKLLLELSNHGIHTHTIACRDKSHFENIVQALKSKKFLS